VRSLWQAYVDNGTPNVAIKPPQRSTSSRETVKSKIKPQIKPGAASSPTGTSVITGGGGRWDTVSDYHYFHADDGSLLGEYGRHDLSSTETIWFNGQPVGAMIDGTLYAVSADHLGTPRSIRRFSDNTEVWRWDGEPFGNSFPTNPNSGSAPSITYNLRFAGQQYDAFSGYYYNWMRDYDPETGRYVQADPLGLGGGLSRYAFVSGNPMSSRDPRGLAVEVCSQPAFGSMPVDHQWLKTDTREAGMGGTRGNVPGNQSGDRPGDRVQVTDHSGRSTQAGASCRKVDGVDENKINALLEIGRPLGRWGPTNQCQSFVRQTLLEAQIEPPAPSPLEDPFVWGF
jgi:RHS repeat-associated protein